MSSKIISHKKDSSVSSVIGTVVLLALVVVSTAIVAVIVISSINDTAQVGPIISFEASANPYMLYNAGGEAINWENTKIYYKGLDITGYSYIGMGDIGNTPVKITTDPDSKGVYTYNVYLWNTGEAVLPYSTIPNNNENRVPVSEIMIQSNANGKATAIYTGSKYEGGSVVPIEKEYSIIIESDHGSVSVVSKAKSGDTITFTVTPDDGYKIFKVMVEGTTKTDYTFTMPSDDVIITVLFKKIQQSDRVTVDITPYTFASVRPYLVPDEYYINYAAGNGHGIYINISGPDSDKVSNIKGNVYANFINNPLPLSFTLQEKGYFANIPNVKGFYVTRGAGTFVLPDTLETKDQLIDPADISVTVNYKGEYHYLPDTFYFNDTTEPEGWDYIPARYVSLSARADLEFEFKPYEDGSKKGITVNLTDYDEDKGKVSYYTVQDVSGVFDNVTLIYDAESNIGLSSYEQINNNKNKNKDDFKDASQRSIFVKENYPYHYYIPGNNEGDINNAKFLVTAYYIVDNTWRSTEILTDTNPVEHSADIVVSPYGYELGKYIGHGINITVSSVDSPYDVALWPEINAIISETPYSLTTEVRGSNPYLAFNSTLSSEGADINKIEAGKYYCFEILPIVTANPSNIYQDEIENANVKVYGKSKTIYDKYYENTLTIPAGSPYYSDIKFPNITFEASGYYMGNIDGFTGKDGHGVMLYVKSSPYEYLNYIISVEYSGSVRPTNDNYRNSIYFKSKSSDFDDNIQTFNNKKYKMSPIIPLIQTNTNPTLDDTKPSNYTPFIQLNTSGLNYNDKDGTDFSGPTVDPDPTVNPGPDDNPRQLKEGDHYYFWIGPSGGTRSDDYPWDKAMFAEFGIKNVIVSGNDLNNLKIGPESYEDKNGWVFYTENIEIPSSFGDALPQAGESVIIGGVTYILDNDKYRGTLTEFKDSITDSTIVHNGDIFSDGAGGYKIICISSFSSNYNPDNPRDSQFTVTLDQAESINSFNDLDDLIKKDQDSIYDMPEIVENIEEWGVKGHLYCSDNVLYVYIYRISTKYTEHPEYWVRVGSK